MLLFLVFCGLLWIIDGWLLFFIWLGLFLFVGVVIGEIGVVYL